ncbi:MAG: copper amine oxidase N-terminal domain-containing protein, partial [Clostridiales bacterium]|nr:copper amine oxidase N-terminal domain-containing protein [Clostridiales bacterium]
MIKSKLFRVFIAITCLALLSSGAALAADVGRDTPAYQEKQLMDMDPDTPVSNLTPEDRAVNTDWRQLGYPSEELYQKHREIDKYVFEDHADEIRLQGFGVTHTGPRNGFIEIGITPYSEEYAGYLYGIFGSDMVKVVEGQQAVTLPLAAGEPDVEVDALTAVDNAAVGDPGVRVRLNGEMLSFDVHPFIENGRVLVPLRGVMEGLGADVEWDGQTRTVSVAAEGVNIRLVIGENTAKVVKTVDGTPVEQTVELDVAAKLVN